MSQLKKIREKINLTQEELSQKTGISVRTIQRIESGTPPKGHTLKTLAKTLEVEEKQLLEEQESSYNLGWLKVINISSLPFIIFPIANIIVPLIIMFAAKQVNRIAQQIISVQIIWTILATIIFMLAVFMRNWFILPSDALLVVMIVLVLSNVFIILRNAAAIDKTGQLYIRLNFNII